jgi:hypothetical protein
MYLLYRCFEFAQIIFSASCHSHLVIPPKYCIIAKSQFKNSQKRSKYVARHGTVFLHNFFFSNDKKKEKKRVYILSAHERISLIRKENVVTF